MAILLISKTQKIDDWRAVMAPLLPGVAWRAWPDVGVYRTRFLGHKFVAAGLSDIAACHA